MSTEQILEALHAIDEAPWDDLYGKPLNPRGLAQRLRRYEVSSTSVRVGDWTGKGYRKEDLHDAWARYLPSGAPQYESATSATNATDGTEPLWEPPPDDAH